MREDIIHMLTSGLYNKQSFSADRFWVLNGLFNDNYSYDCYCPDCKSDSVFNKIEQAKVIAGMKEHFAMHSIPLNQNTFKSVHLKCSRNPEHRIALFYLLHKTNPQRVEITKVGQFPSVADIVNADTKRYRKVLDTNDNHELNKAIGLYSHGVGVGSFVYLRRIFENLIEKAHMQASELPDWDDEEFSNARMNNKIGMLKDYLPEFLVENRIIYSILSKGVHELTEDECLEAFPAIRMGIELILEEEILRQEKERKKREAAQSIASIHQRLKQVTQ